MKNILMPKVAQVGFVPLGAIKFAASYILGVKIYFELAYFAICGILRERQTAIITII